MHAGACPCIMDVSCAQALCPICPHPRPSIQLAAGDVFSDVEKRGGLLTEVETVSAEQQKPLHGSYWSYTSDSDAARHVV